MPTTRKDAAPKPKRPPKTVKEKKFVKAYLETGNATEAAAQVYDVSSHRSANAIAGQNLAKLDMTYWLDKAGLTDEVISQNAARIALTSTKQNQFTGEIEPDNKMQLEGMKFASQLKGLVKAGDTFVQNNTQVNVQPLLVRFIQE